MKMKSLLLALAALCVTPAVAQQRINPGSQVNWPTACNATTSMVYNPKTKTCVDAASYSSHVPTTSSVLKGDGAGNAAVATPGTDYVVPGGTVAAASHLVADPSTCSTGQSPEGIDKTGAPINCHASSGSGLSGQTVNYYPKANSSTTATGPGLISDDGVDVTVHGGLKTAPNGGVASYMDFKVGTDPGSASSGYVRFKAPATGSGYFVTLPAANASGALTNDGNGGLSWSPSSGGGLSGQSTNYVPLATSSTTSTTSSHFFRAGGQSGVDEAFGTFQFGSQCNYPSVFDACNLTHIMDGFDSTVGATPGSLVGHAFIMNSYKGGAGRGAVENRVTLQRTDSDSQNGIDTPGIKQVDSSTQSIYGVGDIGILYHDNTVHGGMAYGADQGSQNLMRIEEISGLMHGTVNSGSSNRALHITQTANCIAPLSYLCTPVPGATLIDTTTAVASGKGISPQATSSFGVGLANFTTDQTNIPVSSVYGFAHNAGINPSQPFENPVDTTVTFDAGVGSFAPGDAVCVLPTNQAVGFEEQSVITSVSGSAGAQTIHLPLAAVQDSPAVFKGYCMYLSFDSDAAQGVRYALPAVSIDGTNILYGYPITSSLQGGVIPAAGITYGLFDNSSRSGWHLYRGARVWYLDTTSPNFMPLNMANVITYVEPNGTFAPGDTVEAVDYNAQKIDGLDLYAGQDIAGVNPAHATALTAHLSGKGINGQSAAVVMENDTPDSQYTQYGGALSEPAAQRMVGSFGLLLQSSLSPQGGFTFSNHQAGQTSYNIWDDPWGRFSIDAGGYHFSTDVFGGSYWGLGIVSGNEGVIAGVGDGAANHAGVELKYPTGYDRTSTWLVPCNEAPLNGQPTTICLTSQGATRTGYVAVPDRGLAVSALNIAPPSGVPFSTNGTIDFGPDYGAAAIYLYDGGSVGARYGWGLNSAEMQFFTPSGSANRFTWNGGGDMQATGVEEIMRLTNISSGVGTLGMGSGGVFGFTSGSTSAGALDTGISRASTGVLDVGNGTPGDASGTLNAAHYGAGALANGMTATTQSAADNSTKVATTAYVDAAVTGGSGTIAPETVASSSTPTFSSSIPKSYIVVTSNITTFTLAAGANGADKVITFCEDSTGGYTVAPPSNIKGFFTPSTTASSCSTQNYYYNGTLSKWVAVSPGVVNE